LGTPINKGLNKDELDFLKHVADELISHSEKFEETLAARGLNVIEGLVLLNELAALTKESIPKPEAEKKNEDKKENPVSPVEVKYTCSSQTYKPALQDPSIIEALLALREKRNLPVKQVNVPKTDLTNKEIAESKKEIQIEEPPSFAFQDIPVVDAHPKVQEIKSSANKPNVIATTVLKSKK